MTSGCCKPPTYCGFTFVNATFWEVPKSGPAAQDSDCTTWSNNQDMLCYNCKSCKGGVLASLKRDWKHLTIFNISMLLFLIIVYTIAGCAFRDTRNDKRRRGYP
ncbi:Tetraspanin/Peripherin [Macleaya cordata]|uniref:Tetraspanin/Peripherin n=1 Tax=Macleaya cordata TaxID=56857 RepID=A0A200Q7I2_MACCD|nr:Tetraspanin/Peripherin [Macleaya cordata]